ncbi:MAG: chemotaxis response regulator protein-glutamate methylesterase [Acidobacteria bacterium]|nr:chemotaxis response regulator protein-glutamate methylesterase [Acidobacteriota bacterium]MBI3426973.1 chemotaxis response regulator protein-glutamate methylesterase [Acidobacteriota bacterium]
MQKIRVLIVDDAVVVRRMVADTLATDPQLEVVATAANGRIALAKLNQVKPDILVMDVEMPELDGLETLKELRKTHPRLPVIMFSTLTERGAAATLEALTLGANDYVTKPANVGSVAVALQRLRDELIPKIKGLCPQLLALKPPLPARAPGNGTSAVAVPQLVRAPLSKGAPRPVEILAIGVSTGGPNALAELLPALPADFPVPIVIVQHMPALFTKLLAERLQAKSTLKIREGVAGEVLRPGQAWIAPGGQHMVVESSKGVVRLGTHQEAPENSCRPAVDVLFRSVCVAYGAGTLAVILTGMGRDGLRGCELIHQANGQILAQDEASSVVWGMPGVVAQSGLADKVLPLNQLAPEILRRIRREDARSHSL